jgi:glycerol-1-phosphate dehydrogenase [NAD(P)+]
MDDETGCRGSMVALLHSDRSKATMLRLLTAPERLLTAPGTAGRPTMTGMHPTAPGTAAALAARWDLPLRTIESGPEALAALPGVLASFAPVAEIGVLGDGTPKTYRDRGGEVDVDDAVRRLLPPGTPVRAVTAAGGPHGPVLDEPTVAAALDAARGVALMVAVGSGTVADLAKRVAVELAVPVVVVQTAASVNGYADSLSVLVRNGAKRTEPSTWPNALIIDHDVLRGAPDRLTRAGVGDATAAWVSPADWYLACALGLDREFDADTLSPVLAAADGLLTTDPRTPEALCALVDTLTLGGLAIGAIGTTAALSGCEHLVSHLLDMAAMADGTAHDLHGAQVGVATVVSAALWQVALDEVRIGALDPSSLAPPPDLADRVHAAWSGLDPSGRLGAECWTAVDRKITTWREHRDGTARFLRGWAEHEEALRRYALPPEVPARALARWGAPLRFDELSPAVDPARARWALRSLPYMRDRFTLVDLLLLAGRWTDDLVERVLDRAARAGGGVGPG